MRHAHKPAMIYDNAPIDKDQCFYCFRTQFDGLFISPLFHKAFCPAHLGTHEGLRQDGEYVYLKKHHKAQEPKQKMMRLEIKQQPDAELYDLEIDLYKGGLKAEPSAEEAAVMDKVVNSDSSARRQEMKSWTQEYAPCEHTIDFQQHPISDLQLLHCALCELDQNLWCCLTCGALGCGRAQFGGVPGNTHALAHSKDSGHPIAVKLGSLSKDVADVYCYSCDEDITFPNLAHSLKTFGIDLENFTKTEKNLVELQIEQNLEWEFNMLNEAGEQLPFVNGKELVGLKNLGNSCYLSSVVQTLFALEEYKQFGQVPLQQFDEKDGLNFQLVKLAHGLLSGEFGKPLEDGSQVGIAPTSFKTLIGKDHEEFSSMKQQDAFEFWNYLLTKVDDLDKHLNDVFRFVTIDKFKIAESSEVMVKKQLTESLTLPMVIELDHIDDKGVRHYKPQKFMDSLTSYLSPEEIDWKKDKAIKTTFIKSYPKYLVTAIQRIQIDTAQWIPVKTDVQLDLPETFDLEALQPSELLSPGESIKEDNEAPSFEPNMDALNELLQMGFPENRCLKALYNTGNNSGEMAMEWLFQHMEDVDIDAPLVISKQPEVDPAQVGNLMDMGFSEKLATKALLLNNKDANQAVEWLFSNPDDDGELPTTAAAQDDSIEELLSQKTPGKYQLKAVICHKGTQVTSGHYVVFIKKHDRWVLFNDEKVVDVSGDKKSREEMEKNGYIYVWERL